MNRRCIRILWRSIKVKNRRRQKSLKGQGISADLYSNYILWLQLQRGATVPHPYTTEIPPPDPLNLLFLPPAVPLVSLWVLSATSYIPGAQVFPPGSA